MIISLVRFYVDLPSFNIREYDIHEYPIVRFYVDLFSFNIREYDKAIAIYNFVQQEHVVTENEFNVKDQEHPAIFNAIEKLWIAGTSADYYIDDHEEAPQEDYEKWEKSCQGYSRYASFLC